MAEIPKGVAQYCTAKKLYIMDCYIIFVSRLYPGVDLIVPLQKIY